MHPLVRPRHLAVTALVFLVMGGAGTGLVGVSAAEEARHATIIEGFTIPLPAQGDRGNYSLVEEGSFVVKSGNVSFGERWLRFEWFEDRMLPTQDGELVLSNRLRYYTGPNQVNGVRGPIMEAGTNVPFAHEWLAVQWDPEREEVDMVYEYMLINTVPCLLRHGLQGKTTTVTAQAIEHDMPCKVPGAGWQHATNWRPVGIVVGSDPAILVVEVDFRRGTYDATTRMWLQDGLPYPVRMEETWTNTRHDLWGRKVYILKELVAGNEPIATTAKRSPLPPLQMVEGLPDERALRMTFPLAEALDVATGDEAVADFLAAHPQAYVGSANHWIYEDPEGRRHDSWTVVWTDGTDRINRTITKTTGPVVVWQPVGPVTTIVIPVDAEPEYEIEEARDRWPEAFPSPEDRVRRLPTVESMLAQWRMVSGPKTDEPANTWGFSLGCGTPCDAARAWVGSKVFRVDDDNPFGSGETSTTSLRHMMAWNGTQVASYSESRKLPEQDAPRALETSSIVGIQSVPDGPWLPLTPQQVIGVTAAALLSALVYWLAPLAKHGAAMPLFSRIRDDRVLEHPMRLAAYEAIEAQPGIHARQLQRLLGRSSSAVTHHLRRLEAAGRVRRTQQGRYTCYFAAGSLDRRLHSVAGVLRAPAARHMLGRIIAEPGITGTRLLVDADVGQSTLQYHLKRLRDEGLVEQRRDGRAMRWYPTERGSQAVGQGMA